MSDDFDIEADDLVLVRVREHGTSGTLIAKFIARVDGFDGQKGPGSTYVRLVPPWDDYSSIRLHHYEAEFEVVEDPDEVNF